MRQLYRFLLTRRPGPSSVFSVPERTRHIVPGALPLPCVDSLPTPRRGPSSGSPAHRFGQASPADIGRVARNGNKPRRGGLLERLPLPTQYCPFSRQLLLSWRRACVRERCLTGNGLHCDSSRDVVPARCRPELRLIFGLRIGNGKFWPDRIQIRPARWLQRRLVPLVTRYPGHSANFWYTPG